MHAHRKGSYIKTGTHQDRCKPKQVKYSTAYAPSTTIGLQRNSWLVLAVRQISCHAIKLLNQHDRAVKLEYKRKKKYLRHTTIKEFAPESNIDTRQTATATSLHVTKPGVESNMNWGGRKTNLSMNYNQPNTKINSP